jgi:hypothetical protein
MYVAQSYQILGRVQPASTASFSALSMSDIGPLRFSESESTDSESTDVKEWDINAQHQNLLVDISQCTSDESALLERYTELAKLVHNFVQVAEDYGR